MGATPPVNRDSADYRDYDQEDADWVYNTKCMRDIGVSIKRIIEYIDFFKQGDHTILSRKASLIEQRKELGKN
ncbi:MerR family transcriptional regulator [Camelliibacillus cellulosilyticus]|uniref:MerR family transcriptional regulator n=1 Tax=Camelliibacillus cellulosilyticus TaxID=2174486 RepID=A0ABV9GL10_9BACL